MKGSLNTSEGPSQRQQNKRLALLEFALIAAVYVADWKHHIFPNKVPYLFLGGWLSLRLRRMRWRGVVTQDAHLFHDTIRTNLLYARTDATDGQIRSALRDAQILDLVESLPDKLDTMVGERGYRFSGGEKQRIAIARLRQFAEVPGGKDPQDV
jgi:hypothetical protein